MRVLRNNSDFNQTGLSWRSTCRFCYRDYVDDHKATWGRSLHYCERPECSSKLNKRHNKTARYLYRDAPDMENWMKNNPRYARFNSSIAVDLIDPMFISINVMDTNTKVTNTLVLRKSDIWRKDGEFTTKFTRIMTKVMEKPGSYQVTFNPVSS